MAPRLELSKILHEIADNVYFQPPAGKQMRYPAIVYQRDSADTKFADNMPYAYKKRYQITVIDRDPDSPLPDKVAALPLCVFDRFFAADDLNHDVFSLYY